MKKILLILISILILTGCASKVMSLKDGITKETTVTLGNIPSSEELVEADEEAVVTEELAGDKYIITATKGDKAEVQEFTVEFNTLDVDGTLPVDMSQFYSNPDKLAKVFYIFNEDETMMTITDENGEEPHSFNVPVNVIYPEYTIADDITIDIYTGYEITDFVTAEEGVEVTSELDEENSLLIITLSKNNWTKTIEKEVIITNSNPFPLNYVGYCPDIKDVTYYLTLNEDGTGFIKTTKFSGESLTWKLNDENNGYLFQGGEVFPITFSEDKASLTRKGSTPRFNGTYAYYYFTLQ